MLTGPRASGKTTTARRWAKSVLQLDDEPQALAVQAGTDTALRGLPEPILIDEWQVVPSVLGDVKRAVDQNSHPGWFLITGSAHAQSMPGVWPDASMVRWIC